MLRLTLIKRKKIPQELTIPISMKIGDLHCIHTKLCFDFFLLWIHILHIVLQSYFFPPFKLATERKKFFQGMAYQRLFWL